MDDEQTNDRSGERKTEELFVEYYDFMYVTARKVLKQKEDAEDVIQALFFKALDWELPADVWKDPKGYLYRTVVNACHDWRRSRKSRKETGRVEEVVEELEMTEPRGDRAQENAAHEVEYLLNSLDDDIARIVLLHADNGYSDAEIAAMTGGSRSRIASILSRARQKLRKLGGKGRGGAGPPAEGSLEAMPDANEE
jgi:RNA polymerase sigma-70 factor, ECF subfamily